MKTKSDVKTLSTAVLRLFFSSKNIMLKNPKLSRLLQELCACANAYTLSHV